MKRLFDYLSAGKTFAATRPPSAAAATTTADKPGRMTAPQGLWADRKIPAFLIELRISKHPKLGRQPGVGDRKLFGTELMQALWGAVG